MVEFLYPVVSSVFFLIDGFKSLLLLQFGKDRGAATEFSQAPDVFPEGNGPEMLVGDRFFPEAFDMYELAIVFQCGITLAAHPARTLIVKPVEVCTDDLLCGILPALRDRK